MKIYNYIYKLTGNRRVEMPLSYCTYLFKLYCFLLFKQLADLTQTSSADDTLASDSDSAHELSDTEMDCPLDSARDILDEDSSEMDNDQDWNIQEEAAESGDDEESEESIYCAASRNDVR